MSSPTSVTKTPMAETDKMKRKLASVLKVLVGVVLLALVLWKSRVSASSFRDGVRDFRLVVLACALPLFVMPVLSVNRWRLFLAHSGIHERFATLWRINLVSMFQGLVLPSTQGMDVFRVYHISRRHPGYAGGSAGAVLVERMAGLLIWCGIALSGLPFVLRRVGDGGRLPVVASVGCFSLAAFAGTAVVVSRRVHALYAGRRPRLRMLARVVAFLDETHATLVAFPYRESLVSSVGLIFMCQLCSIACVWLLFRACGVTLPFWAHMSLYPIIAIVAMMPVTIGGLGVREGAFAYFYSLAGVSAETSVCVSILNYAVLLLLPAAIGGVLWVFVPMTGGDK